MKVSKPIIFLDIEGVLSTKQYVDGLRRNGKVAADTYGYLFDPNAVEHLRNIVNGKDVGIVLTSSWRNAGLDTLRRMWDEREMPGEILDITPFDIDCSVVSDGFMVVRRGYEVKQWLRDNGRERNYIIIDHHDDFLPEQNMHIVKPDKRVGLTSTDAKNAINMLA